MNVLLILDHAPDYREAFLRELGKYVDLTVAAQPCRPDGLYPPDERAGYEYHDLPSKRVLGLYWQAELAEMLCCKDWDVICCDLNLRHLNRIYLFLVNRASRKTWIWRGHIFGRNDSWPVQWVRKCLLKNSGGCLAYSEPIAESVINCFDVKAYSFNNTQVRVEDFRAGFFDNHAELRLLFVGRNQLRKKLERLIELAKRRGEIFLRLIGPGMDSVKIPAELLDSGRVEIFGRTTGKDLNEHFDWCDMVVSPGDVGLMVMSSAQHGKGIVIDNDSHHGPEYWLAKEAGQSFIPFEEKDEVDRLIDHVLENRWKLKQLGSQLQEVAKQKYTIEYMAGAHYKAFMEAACRGGVAGGRRRA